MRTDDSATRALQRQALHGLLAFLLLLATTGGALHPYALEQHHGGHPCAVCLASANAGAAPLPVALTPPPCDRTSLAHGTDPAPWISRTTAAYRARGPPV
ncbi:MAG: hypothetical protein IT493_06370 [Gammaproteobacteria bacterium]|nr:hypothetical protein [Gammaproteobacteria bacterium]